MHGSRRLFLTTGLMLAAVSVTPCLARVPVDAWTARIGDLGFDLKHAAIDVQRDGVVVTAFVDGRAYPPDTEALRAFYGDLYRPFHVERAVPVGMLAAMQPDNGAGQVSGDRAQSVGKAGDLKATTPGGVKSGTSGAKAIDAQKQSWIERAFRRFVSSVAS